MSTRIIIQSVLGLILLTGGAVARAQEPLPTTISPLQVERDPNGVNLITGKIELGPPALAVPGAPNLRFERLQNAAPYVSGSQSGTSIVHASYSVHTNTGTSESFRCIDFQCQGLTYTGSTFVTGTAQSTYTRGGSGEIYRFDLKHVRSGTAPETMLYYASSVTYPNGEVIT